MANNLDYNRLNTLSRKIKNNTATKQEKDEYMLLLYQNGNITQKQYQDYKADGNAGAEVLQAGIAIGGIILFAYLLGELFKGAGRK